jgi:hypothetical protein
VEPPHASDRAGQVVLLVQPAAGGVLIPSEVEMLLLEVEHQQKCCADHRRPAGHSESAPNRIGDPMY